MNRRLPSLALAALAVSEILSAALCDPLRANDTVVYMSAARGGIQFRKENRISLEKERLSISLDQVTVEYEFLNNSNQDINAEVAFPNPDRDCFHTAGDPETFRYDPGFQLWVEGVRKNYETETHGLMHRRDFTSLLRGLGIDIATCGRYEDEKSPDLSALSKQDLDKLLSLGLVNADRVRPQWKVRQEYFWEQAFPAGRIVHIKHVYKPGIGESGQMPVKYLDRRERRNDEAELPFLDNACLSAAAAGRIMRKVGGPDFEDSLGYVVQWVDYILKTANNWQGPIKDFELDVEQSNPNGDWWVNFCWSGTVQRLGPNHIHVRAHDFSPSQDLHIIFLPM
jgi:hypothetical protein